MTFFLGYLTAGIAIAQFSLQHDAYIWISSVIITAILMIMTLVIITVLFWGKNKRSDIEEDGIKGLDA